MGEMDKNSRIIIYYMLINTMKKYRGLRNIGPRNGIASMEADLKAKIKDHEYVWGKKVPGRRKSTWTLRSRACSDH